MSDPVCKECKHFVPMETPSWLEVLFRGPNRFPTPPLCSKIRDPIFGAPETVWDARGGKCGIAGKFFEHKDET
jgi:hypothetical protein